MVKYLFRILFQFRPTDIELYMLKTIVPPYTIPCLSNLQMNLLLHY